MTLEDAKVLALQILKQVMEEKIQPYNVELGVVSVEDKQFRYPPPPYAVYDTRA